MIVHRVNLFQSPTVTPSYHFLSIFAPLISSFRSFRHFLTTFLFISAIHQSHLGRIKVWDKSQYEIEFGE